VIHHIIHHLLKGQIDASDALTLEYLIRTQAQKIAFDAVILGCTELPLLHHHFPIRIDQPLYDSLHIPAKKIGAYL
jgi:aspartate/glutamate racemase